MTEIPLKPETLATLRGKVIVISGSARGIGAATVSQLYSAGANIVHGDWDEEGGSAFDDRLHHHSQHSWGDDGRRSHFVRLDVTDYESVVNIFDFAWRTYGKVDIAISNAGIQEIGNWFDPELGLEGVRIKPNTKVIDVNLTGTVYFARVAAVYLKQGAKPDEDKSLILVSSAAGFKETPGLFTYQASKHGVLGLVRSLRLYFPKSHGIRVNAICPWMTDTAMVKGIRENWIKEGLPVNEAGDVARVMIEVAADRRWNGRAVFVEGGRGWDIEEGIDRTEPQWLGEELSKTLARGQELLGDGTDWVKLDSKH